MGLTVREAIERADLEGLSALIDEKVVWVGVYPGQLCRNRQEVLDTFEAALARGVKASPEIVVETDEALVVDPHVEPPPEHVPGLHQVFVLEEGRVVELRDYPDRASALGAVHAE